MVINGFSLYFYGVVYKPNTHTLQYTSRAEQTEEEEEEDTRLLTVISSKRHVSGWSEVQYLRRAHTQLLVSGRE